MAEESLDVPVFIDLITSPQLEIESQKNIGVTVAGDSLASQFLASMLPVVNKLMFKVEVVSEGGRNCAIGFK